MQSSWASGSGHDSYSTLRAAYYSPPRPNRYNRTSLSQLHNPHSTVVDPPGSRLRCGTAGMHTYTAFSERIYKQITILTNYIFLHRHCKYTICPSHDGYSNIKDSKCWVVSLIVLNFQNHPQQAYSVPQILFCSYFLQLLSYITFLYYLNIVECTYSKQGQKQLVV